MNELYKFENDLQSFEKNNYCTYFHLIEYFQYSFNINSILTLCMCMYFYVINNK